MPLRHRPARFLQFFVILLLLPTVFGSPPIAAARAPDAGSIVPGGQPTLGGTTPCREDEFTLCLGRLEVVVFWEDFQGGSGPGRAREKTFDAGWFWFFEPDNVEVLVKVVDGRLINDHLWLFFGSLSNVEFTLFVRDTLSGGVRTYRNDSGQLASFADLEAFPAVVENPPPGGSTMVSPNPGSVGTPGGFRVPLPSLPSASHPQREEPEPCVPDTETLCLLDDRFRITVRWEDFQGGAGPGRAVPETSEAGFFWFFRPENLELVVKVLDGRPVNDRFWLFVGAVTNVAWTVTVEDLESGRSRLLVNPAGRFASRADLQTFSDGALCGTLLGVPCEDGEVCDPLPHQCRVADGGGTCRLLPDVCAEIFEPVCGCDGVTYSNDCERLRVGVGLDSTGPCPEG